MHTIPNELLQTLHDYLVTRPMNEVEGMVMAIRQTCKPVQSEREADG